MRKIPVRWIAITIFLFSSMLNYLDRSLLAAVAPALKGEFGLTNHQYGQVVSVFSIVYALTAPLAGLFIDRVGLNIGAAVAVTVWSAAGAMTGLTHSFRQLIATAHHSWGWRKRSGIPLFGESECAVSGASRTGAGHRVQPDRHQPGDDSWRRFGGGRYRAEVWDGDSRFRVWAAHWGRSWGYRCGCSPRERFQRGPPGRNRQPMATMRDVLRRPKACGDWVAFRDAIHDGLCTRYGATGPRSTSSSSGISRRKRPTAGSHGSRQYFRPSADSSVDGWRFTDLRRRASDLCPDARLLDLRSRGADRNGCDPVDADHGACRCGHQHQLILGGVHHHQPVRASHRHLRSGSRRVRRGGADVFLWIDADIYVARHRLGGGSLRIQHGVRGDGRAAVDRGRDFVMDDAGSDRLSSGAAGGYGWYGVFRIRMSPKPTRRSSFFAASPAFVKLSPKRLVNFSVPPVKSDWTWPVLHLALIA